MADEEIKILNISKRLRCCQESQDILNVARFSFIFDSQF